MSRRLGGSDLGLVVADDVACSFAGYDRSIEVLLGRMTAVEVGDKDRPSFACRNAVGACPVSVRSTR
jgi:hypothetical protein